MAHARKESERNTYRREERKRDRERETEQKASLEKDMYIKPTTDSCDR